MTRIGLPPAFGSGHLRLLPGVFLAGAAVALSSWSGQALLLVLGLIAGFMVLLWAAGPIWAFIALLIETSLMDRLSLTFHGATIRPEAVVAVAAIVFVGLSLVRSRTRPRWLVIDALLVGWLAMNGVSSLFAPRPLLSLKEWASLLLSASAYFLFRSLTHDRLIDTVRLFLILGAAACGIGVIAYLLTPVGVSIGTQFNRDASLVMATGTLKEADIFGSFAACLLLLSAGWLALKQSPNVVGWLALMASAAALASSLARSAWLGAIIGVAAGLIVWRAATLRRSISVLAVAGVTVLATGLLISAMGIAKVSSTQAGGVVIPPHVIGNSASKTPSSGEPAPGAGGSGLLRRIATLADLQNDPTVRGRWHAASLALDDWERSPIIGRGTASFGQVYTDTSHQPAWIFNVELRALHDSGIIGLALFGGFSVGLILMAFGRTLKQTGTLTPVLLGASLALLIAAQATEPFQLMWPWILLGLLATSSTREVWRDDRDDLQVGKRFPEAATRSLPA